MMDYKKFAAGLRSAAGSYALFYGAPRGDLEKAADIIEELSAKLEPPNDPLTLEELREMDGEPVWLRGNGLNRWYIFNGFSLDGIPFFTPEIGWKPWTAYRRRPEDGTKEEEKAGVVSSVPKWAEHLRYRFERNE